MEQQSRFKPLSCQKYCQWKPNICLGIFVTSAMWKCHTTPSPIHWYLQRCPIWTKNFWENERVPSLCTQNNFCVMMRCLKRSLPSRNTLIPLAFVFFARSPAFSFYCVWEVLSPASQALSPFSKILTNGSSRCVMRIESPFMLKYLTNGPAKSELVMCLWWNMSGCPF